MSGKANWKLMHFNHFFSLARVAVCQDAVSVVHIWDHMPWHRKFSFFLSLITGNVHAPFFLPSGKVLLLMAVYSTARAWIFTGRTKRRRTSTSHKYLFSTFLPASAFIYWLFGNFVWLRRESQTHKRNRTTFKKDTADESEGHFLVCFVHSTRATFTHYPGSQSQLWAFFDLKKHS